MKKLIIATLIAASSVAAFAQIPSYQVYDLTFNAKTTVAKGVTTLPDTCCEAGTEYCYREQSNVKIKGVLGGCHCGAILANESCKNAILYLWDDTRKLAITNVETETGWHIQVIGKNRNKVEHFMRFTATYGEYDQYKLEMTLCGFGKNIIDSKDANYNYANSISGYFAGLISAPYYYKAGVCTVCGVSEPDTLEQSIALAMCGCTEDEGAVIEDMTPFGGTYTIKYNSSKSKKSSKDGLTTQTIGKIFGLPSYVGAEDYVATTIGE